MSIENAVAGLVGCFGPFILIFRGVMKMDRKRMSKGIFFRYQRSIHDMVIALPIVEILGFRIIEFMHFLNS